MAENIANQATPPTKTEEPALKNPHDLVTREDVQICLRNNKGPSASLKSFEMVDFTTKGDNYACIVSSVLVQYQNENGEDSEVSYVVKLNPCRPTDFDIMTTAVFKKEIGFYTKVLPALNAELKKVGEPLLRVPTYFHSIGKYGEEVIFLEDMRKSGFKMFDRKKGMDREHAGFVLKELARLHASSKILMSRGELSGVDLLEKFPTLTEAFDEFEKDVDCSFNPADFFPTILQNGIDIAASSPGYEIVATFLKTKMDSIFQLYKNELQTTEQFGVICHGDSWNNNFLFKYSPEGVLEDCRILDMQINRVGSPVLDLAYMLSCSLNGDVRKKEFNSFLSHYYASFASVMASANIAMKFTLPQLEQEYKDKRFFGLISALMLIPIVLMDTEDISDFSEMSSEEIAKFMEDFSKIMMEQMQKNPLLKPRFLDLFDEMIEAGVIH